MSTPAARSLNPSRLRSPVEPSRVAFLGPVAWLDGCCPTLPADGLIAARFATQRSLDAEQAVRELEAFGPDACVVLDPVSVPAPVLGALPGVTLGMLVAGLPPAESAQAIGSLDRLVSFKPTLTGERVGSGEIWRAVPPPVSDLLYRQVRRLPGAPRAMSIGRASEHREALLIGAKHHHDLLQLIHGVSGAALVEFLGEYQVGVYVAPEPGGGFGHQVPMHLAAGQLLLSEHLAPAHGLERNIDYMQVDHPEALVWLLDRLRRFPEMHHSVRVRGRLKAEQFRASRLFPRLLHDLFHDVAAFGRRAAAP